jgi:hypothetical protein
MVINKTGTAKVILASDVVCAQGSSAAANVNAIVTFVNGVVETGANTFHHLSTTDADMTAGTATSYILGNLARGMSSSGGKMGTFHVGDAAGYRPVRVKSFTAGVATGHWIRVACISGNANTGSSTFPDDVIDKVSTVRYYKVTYGKMSGVSAPDTMIIDSFRPSYGIGDGVSSGNTHIRTAYSVNDRASWLTLNDKNPDTTLVQATPTYIFSDTLATGYTLRQGVNSLYFVLARLKGTTTNTLVASTDIKKECGLAENFVLEQNYPNPFNPATTIRYVLPSAGNVSVIVYNQLGKEVTRLVEQYQPAGAYSVDFNAGDLASGLYFYTVRAGAFQATRKMMLLK